MKPRMTILLAVLAAAWSAEAKVDLVSLPKRNTVQLTIYNSADMTLVRDGRDLTLQKGANRLQFSWANTLIDPTSLDLLAKAQSDKIDVLDLDYPPRVQNLGVWTLKSGVSGKVPVEISYLTSGLSWRAFYMGTLTADEKNMRLEGYVRVANNSGEDYENAQTRLIVGQVHLLDQISELARRRYPYGSPLPIPMPAGYESVRPEGRSREAKGMMAAFDKLAEAPFSSKPKEIAKEGLSEYFLYTIEGTETIPNGWSKRLPSLKVDEVPVLNLYKFEEERYGTAVIRFLSFKNDKEHKMGETPVPGGMLKVYRTVDNAAHLSYEGQSEFKYIPVDEDVELNLGMVGNVVVEPKLMDFKTDRYMFDGNGNVSGWDEIRTFKMTVKNTRDVQVKVEVQRNFPTKAWALEKSGDFGAYEKIDMDTAKFTLELAPQTKKEFQYILSTRHGLRAD